VKPSLRKLVALVLGVIACTAYTVAAFVDSTAADPAQRPTFTTTDAPQVLPLPAPARCTS
ncbi:MAG: hypothetical protein V3T22_07185, partial [Planctomycetota bacterium]